MNRKIQYQKVIKYWGVNGEESQYVKCIPSFQFSHPFDILSQTFHGNDYTSNISSIRGAEEILNKLIGIDNGELKYCLITVNQDPIIECRKNKSKIIDPGPDEIHSVPPNEIYPPNWNKRNPGIDEISNIRLKEILKDWIMFLKYCSGIKLFNMKNVEIKPADNNR